MRLSAYWRVNGNPKPSARRGHIKHLLASPVDLFFGREAVDAGFPQIMLDKPPASELNLAVFSRSRCFLKFNLPVQPEQFRELAAIWLSKVLLIKMASEVFQNTDHFVWVDCIYRIDAKSIQSSDANRVTVSRYRRPHRRLFGGSCGTAHIKTLGRLVRASVIKVPVAVVDEFSSRYLDMVQWVDDEYRIYDEEIVLSCMLQKWPDLFSAVN
jgi:hypothetical protein